MNYTEYKTDFLPLKLQRSTLYRDRFLTLGVLLLMVTLLSGSWILAQRSAALEQEKYAIQKTIQAKTADFKKASSVHNQLQLAENLSAQYDDLLSPGQSWSELLWGLNSIMPDDLWLAELELGAPEPDASDPNDDVKAELTDREITMKGYAKNIVSVGILLVKMGELDFFKELSLESVVSASPEGIGFQIKGYLKEEL